MPLMEVVSEEPEFLPASAEESTDLAIYFLSLIVCLISDSVAGYGRLRRIIANQEEFADHASYPLLFDPQTAGGLLASVPADRADSCLSKLRESGYTKAQEIGEVLPAAGEAEAITLRTG